MNAQVPAPARPLKTDGPPCVPVSVVIRHGAAHAPVVSPPTTNAAIAATEKRFIGGYSAVEGTRFRTYALSQEQIKYIFGSLI